MKLRPPGRPSNGERPMTSAEKQSAYRKRQKQRLEYLEALAATFKDSAK
jgi:hypothetical protein